MCNHDHDVIMTYTMDVEVEHLPALRVVFKRCLRSFTAAFR